MEIQVEQERAYVEDTNGNILAEVTYPTVSDNMADFQSIFVSPALQNSRLFHTLMCAAVAHLQARCFSAVVSSPTARDWFINNPGFARALLIE